MQADVLLLVVVCAYPPEHVHEELPSDTTFELTGQGEHVMLGGVPDCEKRALHVHVSASSVSAVEFEGQEVQLRLFTAVGTVEV